MMKAKTPQNTSTPAKLKVPKAPQAKMADWPVDYRVLLRMITLHEQRQTKVISFSLDALYNDTGITVAESTQAIIAIFDANLAIMHQVFTPKDFSYELPGEVVQKLQSAAANYRQHLEALAKRAAPYKITVAEYLQNARQRSSAIPEHLQPIPKTQWQSHKEKAIELAERLKRPALVPRLAKCLARLGEAEVTALVEKALAAYTKGSLSQQFFDLYTSRRDILLPG